MARILVVEDNPTNMKLAVLILEKAGNEVLQATDAEEGIHLAHTRMPELILMDVHLPGMDGLSATRLLKGDAMTSRIKIVALTALAMNGDREKAEAAGCDGYITKPIHYKEMMKVVWAMVGESQTPGFKVSAAG